ncbi:MAG: hypothetical protein FJW19_07355 [Actinobacteria bacterium]|nr:hypothetical protein [Actinomycetota bacterium]
MILTPVLMVLIMFGVYAGRSSEALIQVRHAADQAARAASKVSRSSATNTAAEVARKSLANSGRSCTDILVDTSLLSRGDDLTVRVSVGCTIETRELVVLGIRSRRVNATSTEIVDRWRVDS